MNKEIILVKNGEIVLKGLNRSSFEDVLIKNMKNALKSVGEFKFTKSQSTIEIEAADDSEDLDDAARALSRVFGIAAFSRAAVAEKDINAIENTAREYLSEKLKDAKTFKVEAKRSDKSFPLKSPEIQREVGGYLLSKFPNLKVDVHNPEITVTVEVREKHAFIRGGSIKGAGGMPVSTNGRAAVLISGGIDSPVASYMMAKRGIELVAVHFASPPYTTELAEKKVMKLLKIISEYSGPVTTYVVPFTEIQEQIRKNCPEEYFTIIMRRYMMKISEIIACHQNCSALITGESVGQVASQTIYALGCTDAAVNMPVFRPCIGMDKVEIVNLARKIGTFETSIEPYEDCCTVFTPRHPKTRAKLPDVEKAEKPLDEKALIQKAVDGARRTVIKPD